MHSTTIPILNLATAGHAGCGACASADSGPVCRGASAGDDAPTPLLQGPAVDLQRLMQGLADALGFDVAWPQQAGIRGLQVLPGEVTLTLAVPAGCASPLADAAFQALRGLMPDTDIYIAHSP